MKRSAVEKVFRELGCPELPPLPAPIDELIEPNVPVEFRPAAAFARGEAVEWLLAGNGPWAVGVGQREDKQPELVVLVDPAHRKVPRLPRSVTCAGRSVKVRSRALAYGFKLQAAPPMLVRQSGNLTGCACSNEVADLVLSQSAGGTYSGTFYPLLGNGRRGLTAAHVALGFGFEEFVAGLPGSIGRLFRSPMGEGVIVSSGAQVGQNNYRLFRVDTPWPILVPALVPTPGPALTVLYVDIAAGDVNPTTRPIPPQFIPAPTPPPNPPRGRTIAGANLGVASYFPFNEPVYAIGQRGGIRWGRATLAGVVAIIPLPIPGVPVILAFNLNVYDLAIAPGDSGMTIATVDRHLVTGIGTLGLGGSFANPVNDVTLAVPPQLAQLFGNVRFT